MTVEEHNRKVLSGWEKYMNDNNKRARIIMFYDDVSGQGGISTIVQDQPVVVAILMDAMNALTGHGKNVTQERNDN